MAQVKSAKILFVCLGNICRSPLAQGIFEKQITELGLSGKIKADSAGTSGWHKGEPPHSGSIRIAEQKQVKISHQKSRPVNMQDGSEFDIIVAMDKSNFRDLRNEFAVPPDKLVLMRDFDPEGRGQDVPDPWGQGPEAFREVFEILERSIREFIQQKILI